MPSGFRDLHIKTLRSLNYAQSPRVSFTTIHFFGKEYYSSSGFIYILHKPLATLPSIAILKYTPSFFLIYFYALQIEPRVLDPAEPIPMFCCVSIYVLSTGGDFPISIGRFFCAMTRKGKAVRNFLFDHARGYQLYTHFVQSSSP